MHPWTPFTTCSPMLLDGTFDAVYKAPLVLGYAYNRTV